MKRRAITISFGAATILAATILFPSDLTAQSQGDILELVVSRASLSQTGETDDRADDDADGKKPFLVGHTVIQVTGRGSLDEARPLQVHLWYPAHPGNYKKAPPTSYTSQLHGVTLVPSRWDPLSWTVSSTGAREDVELHHSSAGQPFPVIVFSHGSTAMAIDFAYTLELLASHGFVVAAPDHVGNTQDDVRIDLVNSRAGSRVLNCFDGSPSPCSKADVRRSLRDRALDVGAVIDAIGAHFGDRVQADRVGVMGHSRGTVTALSTAGGSAFFGIAADPRVGAIMGLSIGAPGLTFNIDLAKIHVPTLLVNGGNDRASPPSISVAALDAIPAADKSFVLVPQAYHRHYNSAVCAQMQSSGSITAANSTRALLDRHTFERLVLEPINGTSMDYCAFSAFTTPTDIRPLVRTTTGFDVSADNVPTSGLDTETLRQVIGGLASNFFHRTLGSEDRETGAH